MKSEEFRLSRWKCYWLMLMHQAAWLGWTLLVVVLGLVAVGFIYSPWMGIAAIGIDAFIVVMALSFVIIAYGFGTITGLNMTNHTLQVESRDIEIGFAEGEPIRIPCSDARPYSIYPGGVLVPVEGKRSGWLWVPPSAFATPEEFQIFLKKIYISANESNTK